jgi:hypothetical protein
VEDLEKSGMKITGCRFFYYFWGLIISLSKYVANSKRPLHLLPLFHPFELNLHLYVASHTRECERAYECGYICVASEAEKKKVSSSSVHSYKLEFQNGFHDELGENIRLARKIIGSDVNRVLEMIIENGKRIWTQKKICDKSVTKNFQNEHGDVYNKI